MEWTGGCLCGAIRFDDECPRFPKNSTAVPSAAAEAE